MAMATTFCVTYFLAPLYIVSALVALLLAFPTRELSLWFAVPLFVSVLTKPIHSPTIAGLMTPMADYFDYEECFEFTDDEIRHNVNKEGKKYIFAFQPHGVVSFRYCEKKEIVSFEASPNKTEVSLQQPKPVLYF